MAERGIRIDLWTYGLLAEGQTAAAPKRIWVSEIRLNDRRWATGRGLHVGDSTTKLRRLYPKAAHHDRRSNARRSEYWLDTRRPRQHRHLHPSGGSQRHRLPGLSA